jgi:hypothetical protein
MASLLLNECLSIYEKNIKDGKENKKMGQPSPHHQNIHPHSHRDNVSIVVMKLQWRAVRGDGDAYTDEDEGIDIMENVGTDEFASSFNPPQFTFSSQFH